MFLFPLVAVLLIESAAMTQEGVASGPWQNIMIVAGLCLVPALTNFLYSAFVNRLVSRGKVDFFRAQRFWGSAYRTLIIVIFFLQLHYFHWVNLTPGISDLVKNSYTFSLLWGLLPFTVTLLAAWLPLYNLTQRYLENKWGRFEFLVFNTRHTFLIILPLALFFAIRDIVTCIPVTYYPEELNYLVFPVVIVVIPLFLKAYFRAFPMPKSDLRSRLEQICKDRRISCRDILIWPTGKSLMVNAMVTGLFGRLRYFFISDTLIENMNRLEIEAVFGHELGHIRYHHFWIYGLMAVCLMLFFPLFTVLLPYFSPEFAVNLLFIQKPFGVYTETVYMMAIFIIYIRFVFGALSRVSERQADLYGAEVSGSPLLMASALQSISALNSSTKSGGAWRHYPIEKRVKFLEAVYHSPELANKHHKKARAYTAVLLIALAAMVGGHVWTDYFINKPAQEYLKAGEKAYNGSDYEKSAESFSKASALRPDIWELRYFHALALENLGKYERAFEECRTATLLAPKEAAPKTLLRKLQQKLPLQN